MEKVNVALYIRVSTEEQAEEGYSLEAQSNTLNAYCETHGYRIVHEYKDEGISAKNITGRPGLLQLLRDAEQGLFSKVIFWKLSRLSRDQHDQWTIVKQLQRHNVEICSITEQFDTTTPNGRAFFSLLGTFAQLERETLGENVRLGMKQKAKEGEWNGGTILGYDTVEGKLVVNESEKLLVHHIFDLYTQGKGLKAVANQLNKEGFKTKKGNPFSIGAIRTIVHNPTYIGKIRWGQVEKWSEKRRNGKKDPLLADGQHEPIISVEVWNQAQGLITKKTTKNNRQFTGKHILAGFLRCPTCGAAMVGKNDKRTLASGERKEYLKYVCGRSHRSGSSVCSSNTVKLEVIEQEVAERLSGIVQQPEIIREIIRKVNSTRKQRSKPLQEELAVLERQIGQIDGKIDKTFDLFYADAIDSNELKKRKDALEQEKVGMDKRRQEIMFELKDDQDTELPEKQILDVILDFARVFATAEPEKKKLFLKTLVKDITLTPQRKLDKINLHIEIPRKTPTQKDLSQQEKAVGEVSPLLHMSHLAMIRFPPLNPKGPVHLLQQNHPHHLVRKRKLRERQLVVRPLKHRLVQPERPANDKRKSAVPLIRHLIQVLRKLLARQRLPLNREGNHIIPLPHFREQLLRLFPLDLLFLRGRGVIRRRLVRDFHNRYLGIRREPFLILLHGSHPILLF
ncbi:hypothetical protein EL26_02935 [Tumebacillus flagellatus]|uniref:Resolvase n=1 Tax=Tumebacillus flagellatus TaxID=1157490 RepID=A0A074LVF3_9BACL|nr:hypothetical protein EL26_02935 [Tumebacillus flagellatus]